MLSKHAIFRIALLLLVVQVRLVQASDLLACGGDNNWPPMSYRSSDDQQVKGISADILRSIFAEKINIRLLPWARCLYQAKSQLNVDIVMSLFKTPEREKEFLFSMSYMSLTPSYLYSTRRFKSPPIKTLAALENYKICALHGASTIYTQLQPENIESGATSYSSLIKKLDKDYCDIVVDMREVFLGLSELELLPINNAKYRIQALPGTEPYPLQFGVSKTNPKAQDIVEKINLELEQLQRSGGLKRILEHHGIK